MKRQKGANRANAGTTESEKPPKPYYETDYGELYLGKAEDTLGLPEFHEKYVGRVQLILISPPFPLNKQKRYGNLVGQKYARWLSGFAKTFEEYLSPNGSIVLEIGNSWESGQPTMSLLGLKSLLAFLRAGKYVLCQEFVCYNPARLPAPQQWVNVDRVRVKDSFTHIWWMAKNAWPKADNRRVLRPYSKAMTELIKTGKYTSGLRPSEYRIGKKSFRKDSGGAIPSSVLTYANTSSNDNYLRFCRQSGLRPHPARMPMGLAKFFVKFLTEPGDIVMDVFAGSNVTGAAAESEGRKWVSVEPNLEYAKSSTGRFKQVSFS
jgi:DNA methylase